MAKEKEQKETHISVTGEQYTQIREIAKDEERTMRAVISRMIKTYQDSDKK